MTDVVLGLVVATLLVSALLVLWRMVHGPTVLNRTLASDVLLAIIICALGTEAVARDHSTTLPILVSVSLVGFLATVAVSRFVAGDTDGDAPGSPEDAGTEQERHGHSQGGRR